MVDSSARIHDRGYRRFEGTRSGPGAATLTLYRHSLMRALGVQRGARAKMLPVISVAMAYLPAVAFVGIAAFLPKNVARRSLPSYSEYYGFVSAAIIVFVAFVAPEVLCPDRRSRLLGLYLASPLTRGRYIVAKLGAVITVVAAVTLGPPLLLFIAYSLEGFGPSAGDFALLLARIILSGVVLSVFYTAFALGAASLTDRRGFASTGIILAIVLSGAATGVLENLSASRWFRLLNLVFVPFRLVRNIYGAAPRRRDVGLPTWSLVLAFLAWTTLGLGVLIWRYRRLEVTR